MGAVLLCESKGFTLGIRNTVEHLLSLWIVDEEKKFLGLINVSISCTLTLHTVHFLCHHSTDPHFEKGLRHGWRTGGSEIGATRRCTHLIFTVISFLLTWLVQSTKQLHTHLAHFLLSPDELTSSFSDY